jgi:hypothetical protein
MQSLIKLIHFLSLFLYHVGHLESKLEANRIQECMIHSQAYKFEYLYTAPSETERSSLGRETVAYPFGRVESFDNIRWLFIPTNWTNDTYFIKSVMFNEYLCTSNEFNDFWRMRRKVFTLKHENESKLANEAFECAWLLDGITSKKIFNSFYIWNVKYKEVNTK